MAAADMEALPRTDKPTAKGSTIRRVMMAIVLFTSIAFLIEGGSIVQVLSLGAASADNNIYGGARDAIASAVATANGGAASIASSNIAMPPITHTPVRQAWRPSAAPASVLEAARREHASLGLVSLGGDAGDTFLLGVRPGTGTVEAVSPVSLPAFTYTLPIKDPSVRLHWASSGPKPLPLDRTAEGFHHLGDVSAIAPSRAAHAPASTLLPPRSWQVTLRVRAAGSNSRFSAHSTVSKQTPLAINPAADALMVDPAKRNATIDATPCLTPKPPLRLRLRRSVSLEGAEAVLRLTITNEEPSTGVEIGGLGFSMPMNQMFSGRSLPEVAKRCSFTEVYLGGDAGYVQVTRTTGDGPVLLVMPLLSTGGGGGAVAGGFEGWRPLKWEDRANYDWMHEMLYEVVIHSKAYAENEWRSATPWAPPTSAIIPAGATVEYGVRMRLAEDVEGVTPALLAARRPVAIPQPAATLHSDVSASGF